ncbi:MAG TPA: HEAT repeat domain-containing protein, partial [Gemmatimonadaceae bacterium]|nr:HEAT repeat domain-containing protein [Gemmatimonadaceae bacterium]
SSVERRSYFNALVKLQAGVASLVHMLGDGRWYVVRNAADLLGEMGTTAADEALVAAMDHPDARVRRSIVLSLGKLATPRCRTALEEALRHASPERRMVAAQAMAGIRDLRSGAALRRQLEDEGDPAVQHTLLAALGRLATRDAVEALVLAAAPRRKLFRRKASAYRVAAAHALADAGTPAALAALTRLCEDEEREVREVAQRLARPADGTSGPARPVTPTPSYVPVSAEGDPPPADPQPDDASAAAPHPAAG